MSLMDMVWFHPVTDGLLEIRNFSGMTMEIVANTARLMLMYVLYICLFVLNKLSFILMAGARSYCSYVAYRPGSTGTSNGVGSTRAKRAGCMAMPDHPWIGNDGCGSCFST